MGRKNTESWKAIKSMCIVYEIDVKEIYKKAKLLLEIYRRICWTTMERIHSTREDLMISSASSELDGALIYLEQFAPDREREQFECRVAALFRTRWMMEIVDTALLVVGEFPDQGRMYFDILSKCYLASKKYSEDEMLEELNMERSRFYDRKKEAVIVFGIALWGVAIPKAKGLLCESDCLPSMFQHPSNACTTDFVQAVM